MLGTRADGLLTFTSDGLLMMLLQNLNGDIMGASSDAAEALIGGVALFVNGDAGDIDPSPATCNGMPNFAGAPIIASAIQRIRDSITVCLLWIVLALCHDRCSPLPTLRLSDTRRSCRLDTPS
jgi:hypothetical protein